MNTRISHALGREIADAKSPFPALAARELLSFVEVEERWACGPSKGCGHRWSRWVPQVGPNKPMDCPRCGQTPGAK